MEISHLYSLRSLRKVFNIETLDEVVPVNISFDPNKYLPSGSPGVTLKRNLENNRISQFVSVLFPFPPKAGIAPGIHTKVHAENIYQLPQKRLITGHKVKTINMFEHSKLRGIRDYVNDNDAITFVLDSLVGALDFFSYIPDIMSRYKYSTHFYHCGTGITSDMKNKDDAFIPFVSFVNINYCIPIFDHRKVDGMGVYCGFMYSNKNSEEFGIIDTLSFVLSNHQANLFHVDGAKIATKAILSSEVLVYLLKRIKAEIIGKKVTTGTKKEKKAKSLLDRYTEKKVSKEGELAKGVPVGDFGAYTYGPFSAASNSGNYSEVVDTATINTAGTST